MSLGLSASIGLFKHFRFLPESRFLLAEKQILTAAVTKTLTPPPYDDIHWP